MTPSRPGSPRGRIRSSSPCRPTRPCRAPPTSSSSRRAVPPARPPRSRSSSRSRGRAWRGAGPVFSNGPVACSRGALRLGSARDGSAGRRCRWWRSAGGRRDRCAPRPARAARHAAGQGAAAAAGVDAGARAAGGVDRPGAGGVRRPQPQAVQRQREDRLRMLLNAWPPRTAEQADPYLLGVRAPGADLAGAGGDPPYVERDVDGALRAAVSGAHVVMLMGPTCAGKSRTALEALKHCAATRSASARARRCRGARRAPAGAWVVCWSATGPTCCGLMTSTASSPACTCASSTASCPARITTGRA